MKWADDVASPLSCCFKLQDLFSSTENSLVGWKNKNESPVLLRRVPSACIEEVKKILDIVRRAICELK